MNRLTTDQHVGVLLLIFLFMVIRTGYVLLRDETPITMNKCIAVVIVTVIFFILFEAIYWTLTLLFST